MLSGHLSDGPVYQERLASILAMFDSEWYKQALCRDPSIKVAFFASGDNETRASQKSKNEVSMAKLVCLDCPAQMGCLEHAIEVNEYGVWGGTDKEERAMIRAVREGKKEGYGSCPECGSDLTVNIRHSNPTKARCVECNYKWAPVIERMRAS